MIVEVGAIGPHFHDHFNRWAVAGKEISFPDLTKDVMVVAGLRQAGNSGYFAVFTLRQ
jgi:hypothetical protein